jgi:hypothetical protein
MPTSLTVHSDERAATIGNAWLECRYELHPLPRLASLTNRITGTTFAFDSRECSLRFDSGLWRHDVPEWRFCPGSGDAVPPADDVGYRNGFHLPGADTAGWMTAHQLNWFPIGPPGYSAVVYPGYGWYRAEFDLPADVEGRPIEFGLGGGDNQDWIDYWVYVNGALIGHTGQQGSGCWQRSDPSDESYRALRFGQRNCLAVQARGLDRRTPAMSLPDAERYSIGSPLVDQFVAAAPATVDLSDFHLLRCDATDEGGQQRIDMQLASHDGIAVAIRYWVNQSEPVLHKQVTVRNEGAARRVLLEMDVHALTCGHPVSAGGLGRSCTIGGELFCGIRHPAGLARGGDGRLCLRQFPSRILEPGEAYTSKVAVFGAGPAGEGEESCQRYIARHSPRARTPRWISLYDIYGWHDIAGIDDPTPVTEALIQRSLDILADFQARGMSFDYYNIDTGWNNPDGDLRDFDARNFPDGPARIVERVRRMGMKLGLWVSPAAGPMAFHPDARNPGLSACGTLPQETPGVLRGSLCMASEPWRRTFREALLHHIRENGARCFKLDGNAFFCTNPDHAHLPGKYSIEPIMDATIEALEAVRAECPDAFFMYYWNIDSPWWLLHGEALYERGVLMEGATPSDFPSPLLRQSVTLSFDQAAHHAWHSVPLASHDSLGVWISDTRWGSWMGREGWQDAWIMDIARGSGLMQLWGDLSQLDEGDAAFLARASAWVRANADLLREPRRVGGDPWRAQPYGYAYTSGGRAVVFAFNPQFTAASLVLRGADIGTPGAPGAALSMRPFEVQVAQIDLATGSVTDVLRDWRGRAAPMPDYAPVDCAMREVARRPLNWDDPDWRAAIRRAVNGRSQYVDTAEAFERARLRSDERDRRIGLREYEGRADVRAAELIVAARLSRDGMAWHHHALFDVIRLEAEVDGQPKPAAVLPNRWHEQAGGWSWILFRLPLEPGAGQVSLRVQACLPETVDIGFEAWASRGPA